MPRAAEPSCPGGGSARRGITVEGRGIVQNAREGPFARGAYTWAIFRASEGEAKSVSGAVLAFGCGLSPRPGPIGLSLSVSSSSWLPLSCHGHG